MNKVKWLPLPLVVFVFSLVILPCLGLQDARVLSYGTVNYLPYFIGDFETGNTSQFDWTQQHPPDTYVEVVTNPVRLGKYACKYTVINPTGQAWPYNQAHTRKNVSIWEGYWGFSVFVPTDFVASPLWQQFCQFLQGPYPTVIYPSIGLYLEAGKLHVFKFHPQDNGHVDVLWTGDLPVGKWVDFIWYIKFDHTQGFVRLWINGTKVLDWGPGDNIKLTAAEGGEPPFFDEGLYRHPSITYAQSIYCDEVRIASSFDGARTP